MKLTSLLYSVFVSGVFSLHCGNNTHEWAACDESITGSGKYVGYLATKDPFFLDPISNLTIIEIQKMHFGSEAVDNTDIHPDYKIYICPITGKTWFLSVSLVYNKKHTVKKRDWDTAISEMVGAMNEHKTFQSTINTDAGSMTIEAFHLSKSGYY
ncbi:hypothetical protein BB559_001652 [Furculomyces boomerangus]|uniref:Uncharacterized protein n=2 Tax=Harpellales TaxID=61421 RepID=A0A2T9Z1C2_9FUNG|nr:hypothetical protein BB559_001672 [Furculomyces boomerangus]PVU98332.1 hypothetical protein BB559_001652 [Furculomyces boomerangus]PWA01504.1 hypothetical protein BB558_002402 [Smittium angustum]